MLKFTRFLLSLSVLILFLPPAEGSSVLTADGNPVGGSNYTAVRTYSTGEGDAFYTDITYYNGLGLPEQEVRTGAASTGRNLVRPIVYDCMMRPDARSYLPFASEASMSPYVPDALTAHGAFYRDHERAYHETVYESGSWGRPLSSQKPGGVYRETSRRRVMEYGINDGSEDVRELSYTVPPSGLAPVVLNVRPRAGGTLLYTMSVGEDNDTSYVYTDVFGKDLLHRSMCGGVRHDTYYIYDLRDSLVCVVQPEGSAQLGGSFSFASTFCSDYCFTYAYDDRGNIIEKQVPGAGKQVMAYDMRNRMILHADAAMLQIGKYRYVMYDTMDRVVQEGYASLNSSIENIRNAQRGNVSLSYFLTEKMVTRTLSYYTAENVPALSLPSASRACRDDIDYGRCLTLPAVEQIFEEPHIEGTALVRGGRVRTRTYYYDSRGRVTLMTENDSDGWRSIYSWKNDFRGNVLTQTEEHCKDGAFDSMVTDYTYDSRGRRMTMRRDLNGTVYASVAYSYDDLGRLDGKEVAGRGAEAYSYNLQGWQTGISAGFYGEDVFSQTMSYQTPAMLLSVPRFDGMVSEVSWSRSGQVQQTTGYRYDGLGRLTAALRHPMGSQWTLDVWTERDISYDRNGNLLSVTRAMPEEGGCCTMTYSGNRLQSMTRGGTTSSYSYCPNGNLMTDGRRDLQFQYNLLNLPAVVSDASGQVVKARYSYLTDGTKLAVRDAQNDGLSYRGSFVYTVEGTPGSAAVTETLESIAHDEGRFVALSASPGTTTAQFIDTWHVRDYLGSVRTVLDITRDTAQVSDPALAILEQDDYMPSGIRVNLAALAYDPSNRYRFNGKEEQVTGNIGLTDYGARFYDSSVIRWTTPDPLAEKYYSTSPYAFCNNNPVNFVDPDGRDGIYINFPDYVISVGNMQFENLGHSGILLINNQTGLTKYYEYGRYDKQNIGIVRNIKVPNVVIGEDGRPEKESLDKVFGAISQIAGDGGKIEGAYVESNEFEAMNDYAQSLMAENENPEREPYNIMNNNCSTFAEDVLKQDRNIEKKAPISLFNIPNSVVKKWQNEFIPISFNNIIE